MHDKDENGVAYYIDMALLRRAREKALRKEEIEALDRQIERAELDLNIVKTTSMSLKMIQDVLAEMRRIAVEAALNPTADRKALNRKLNELKLEINRIIEGATVDGVNMLDGSMGSIDNAIKAIGDALSDLPDD
ncbi:MAG: hypothetical protein FWG94_04470 [Oscillospiraceae bacterium]|nr:hypothetical protein [Oscillospiraceae bacterium]